MSLKHLKIKSIVNYSHTLQLIETELANRKTKKTHPTLPNYNNMDTDKKCTEFQYGVIINRAYYSIYQLLKSILANDITDRITHQINEDEKTGGLSFPAESIFYKIKHSPKLRGKSDNIITRLKNLRDIRNQTDYQLTKNYNISIIQSAMTNIYEEIKEIL